MTKRRLTLAISEYEHVRDLTEGRIQPEGIDLTCLQFEVEQIFFRFTKYREWDVSELSMGKYVALMAEDNPDLTAIPVFPSRVFRQSSIYVVKDSPMKTAEDLRGKRIGVPEWAQTAAIYTRGWLTHQIGIPLQDIDWVQAGVNQAGRREKVELHLPDGVRYTAVPERSLTEMLLAGDIDAIMTAHSPAPFEEGKPDIVQLFPNYREIEEAYYRETGINPIMHVMAVRRAVLEEDPWIAANLMSAFEQAKQNSYRRARQFTASRLPLPWSADLMQKAWDQFGGDPFPYGIEANRPTLEAYLQYAHEQGVSRRLVSVEELFPKEVADSFRI